MADLVREALVERACWTCSLAGTNHCVDKCRPKMSSEALAAYEEREAAVRELVCQLKHLVDEYDVEQGDAFAAAAALEHMGALWPEVD